ncbi:MAG: malate synthase A, partial [Chitinophagales bacterium]
RGNGAAAIYHLMEDAATAEISRTQVWQWIHNDATLEDGRSITYELYRQFLPEELDKMKEYVGAEKFDNGKFEEATGLFDRLVKDKEFIEFLTLPAYELI